MMVRSKRVTYENLRLRDPAFIQSIDKWFAEYTRTLTGFDDIDTENPAVPMFQPFRIGRLRVENRVQLSAMCQYCATDGVPGEWHFVHYGSRGIGGAGLVSTEMLCTSADARITYGCADIINVSTGQVASHEEPVYGRMYQAPFADRIRNELGITTVVAGNINSADQVNTLVAAGRSDLVALARPIMNEPQFVLNAAAHYGYRKQYWPAQYEAGKFAAELNAARENLEQGELRNNSKPPNPQEMLAIAIARGEVLLD